MDIERSQWIYCECTFVYVGPWHYSALTVIYFAISLLGKEICKANVNVHVKTTCPKSSNELAKDIHCANSCDWPMSNIKLNLLTSMNNYSINFHVLCRLLSRLKVYHTIFFLEDSIIIADKFIYIFVFLSFIQNICLGRVLPSNYAKTRNSYTTRFVGILTLTLLQGT